MYFKYFLLAEARFPWYSAGKYQEGTNNMHHVNFVKK